RKCRFSTGSPASSSAGFFPSPPPPTPPFFPSTGRRGARMGRAIADVIFVAQGSDGTAEEIRKFTPGGTLISSITEAQFDSTFNGQPIDDFCGAYFIPPLVNTPLPVVDVQIASTGVTASILPYGPTYFGGVSVATGDLNGDGIEEIVT